MLSKVNNTFPFFYLLITFKINLPGVNLGEQF